MKYTVVVTKTSDGLQDYIQIMSEDMLTTNIVLVGEIEVSDHRIKEYEVKT